MSKVFTLSLDKLSDWSLKDLYQIIFARRVGMHTESKTNEVLFQKLGNTWYVFSEINQELIYSALPEGIDPRDTQLELFEVIEEHLNKVSKDTKSTRPTQRFAEAA